MNETLKQRQESTAETIDEDKVREELQLIEPKNLSYADGTDPELEKNAEEVVEKLLSLDATNEAERQRGSAAVENLAIEVQKKAVVESEKLKDPVKKMAIRSEEGGQVANALVDLRVQVESLDPARFDFDDGWFSRGARLHSRSRHSAEALLLQIRIG